MFLGLTIVQIIAYALIAVGLIFYIVDMIRYKRLGLSFFEPSFLVPFIIGSICCLSGVVMTWLIFLEII